VQRIGLWLDRAVHLTAANLFAVCIPFLIADGASAVLAAWTGDDWPAYLTWLVGASVVEVWARTAVIVVLRGGTFASALGAALRRPALLLFAAVACGEVLIDPADSSVFGLTRALIVSVVIFASLLALVDTVSTGVPPLRALAIWLREMLRPSRLGLNLVGAVTVAALMVGPSWALLLIPLPDTPLITALSVVPEAFADAVALVFACVWYDAVLEERQGRDLERMLERPESSSSF
jgi:hypothetical protein